MIAKHHPYLGGFGLTFISHATTFPLIALNKAQLGMHFYLVVVPFGQFDLRMPIQDCLRQRGSDQPCPRPLLAQESLFSFVGAEAIQL